MVHIEKIADDLRLVDAGYYVTASTANISYPEQGNDHCFEIEQDSFWFQHRSECILQVVQEFHSNGIILDVGGGNGFVSKYLMDRDIEDVVLLEPGPSGARNATNRGVEYVICSTFDKVNFKPDVVSSIGLFDVLEHIENDAEFLRRIRNVLSPNGRLFLTVPAFNFLWSENDNRAGHFRRYKLKALNDLLKGLGFKVEYSTYFFSFLPPPIFLFRSIPYKLGIVQNDPAKKSKSEHSQRQGLIGKLMRKLGEKELKRIKNLENIWMGSSIICVATKI